MSFSLRASLLAVSTSLTLLAALVPVAAATNPTPTVSGGGVVDVSGSLSYTNAFFTAGADEPEIILEDETGFITRDRHYVMPVESQTLGQITSDFNTSPFTYTLALPKVPQAPYHDVNHDSHADKGVQVFAVAYWTNTWGDAYLERRDLFGGGWSTAYASDLTSQDNATFGEVIGGKYVVYSPDGSEQFPSGFGADHKLFTNDDPEMNIPQGWSVINMDSTPFTINRNAHPTVNLIEPAAAALPDFSNLGYTAAFDAMINLFRHQYSWTKFKNLNWNAISAEFRPRFQAAEQNHDEAAYELALRDFTWAIPDVHVGVDSDLPAGDADFATNTAGGLGFAMERADSGKFLVSFVTGGASADKAGFVLGTQIISLGGQPVADAVAADVPYSSPFSNPGDKEFQQQRYVLRFPLSQGHVMVQYRNPGGSVQTANLKVVNEFDSLSYSSINHGTNPDALPVEFKILPDGIGYIQINSFFDSARLTIQLYERAMAQVVGYGLPGVILDMRHNGGGSGWLADQMAGYFFSHEKDLGKTSYYDPASGHFAVLPGQEVEPMIPAPANLDYSGPVAVLVGTGCISACEFFSWDMTRNHRAAIVGQYGTAGGGGSVEIFNMPGGIQVQFTIGRGLTPSGQVKLEGKGVVPTVKVPINLNTIERDYAGDDVVLDAGVKYIESLP